MENKTVLKGGLSIDWDFGHVFKFSYSYFDHIRGLQNIKDITLEKFRFVMNT